MSTTALAEYCDMLFTRLHLEFGKQRSWWLEIHFDPLSTDIRAYVVIRAVADGSRPYGKPKTLAYQARMKAIEANMEVPLSVKESVVEHHVKRFADMVQEEGTGGPLVSEPSGD